MSTDIAIQTINLTKHFKQRVAVDNLSIEVCSGEVFGFLGPNGAGKTTTIAMLLGLVRPTSGQALLLGHDVQAEPAAALRRVGAMIEAPAFYPYLSGRDNLRVLAKIDGLSSERVQTVLDIVDLEQRARDKYRTYSQGMKQRLAIAAALLAEPEIIILDEPTNGLDPAGTVEVRELIRSLAQSGHTIFLCSHLLHEVEQVCQRVAILKQGRLLAQGSVQELLQRGQSVQVRVVGDMAQAMNVLRSVEWIAHVRQEDDMLLVDAPAERAPDINTLLIQHDIGVAEIRAREESLEHFFLEVTETANTPEAVPQEAEEETAC
jgi:ABC-2 type transport system ATP-binding protein